MGTNTLKPDYSNGEVIDASIVNEITQAVTSSFVGRESTGVPTAGKSLGTAALPWGAVYANSMILDGQAIDTSLITSAPNRIVSGKTRITSGQPQFLKADGATNAMTVEGLTTNLALSINGIAATVSTDIVKTGLTVAPVANNTASVNMTMPAAPNDLYVGEDGSDLSISGAGSEITARVGQIVAMKTPNNEILYGYLKDAATITDIFRGFFFDDTQAPIIRAGLSNTDTLTLMNIGWVFIENNGTTVDVSYTTPVYRFEAPTSPSTGDYWFDITNQVWKRYSGTSFEIINRMLIGIVVLDDTNCIASRSFDFTNTFSDFNNIELDLSTTEIVRSKNPCQRINIYGQELSVNLGELTWNITTDLDTALTEQLSTVYYLYLDKNGQRIISDVKPYYRTDLKGDYHPYQTWRLVGMAYNDGSGDFTLMWDENKGSHVKSGSLTSSRTTIGTTLVTNQTALCRANLPIIAKTKGITAVAEFASFSGGSFGSYDMPSYLYINNAVSSVILGLSCTGGVHTQSNAGMRSNPSIDAEELSVEGLNSYDLNLNHSQSTVYTSAITSIEMTVENKGRK